VDRRRLRPPHCIEGARKGKEKNKGRNWRAGITRRCGGSYFAPLPKSISAKTSHGTYFLTIRARVAMYHSLSTASYATRSRSRVP
jgi:hypothetical protein